MKIMGGISIALALVIAPALLLFAALYLIGHLLAWGGVIHVPIACGIAGACAGAAIGLATIAGILIGSANK